MDARSSYSTSMTSAQKRDERKRKRVQRSPVSCRRDAPDKINGSFQLIYGWGEREVFSHLKLRCSQSNQSKYIRPAYENLVTEGRK